MFGWFKKKDKVNPQKVAADFLGMPGKMIAHSKMGYKLDNPKNLVVFNSIVKNEHGEDLWCGDIDITLEEDNLVLLAAELCCTILVYPEARDRDKRVGFVYKTDGVDFHLGQSFLDYRRVGPVIQYDRVENNKKL